MGAQREVASPLKSDLPSRPGRGFTLIELLVSMTIMGLLALAIHFGFRIGVNAWAKGDDSLERSRTVESTLDLISRQLGSMVPYYSRQKIDDAPVDVLLYQGTERGLRFVTTFSTQSRSAGGFLLVEYFLSPSKEKDGKALVVNEVALPHDELLSQSVFSSLSRGEDNIVVARFFEFSVRPNSIFLIDGLDNVQFRYFRPLSEEGIEPGVVLPAQKKERLPAGIEIRLRWNESGLFPTKEFSIFIPTHAAM
jgi:prepilin-type N-terminal cleavage/methylation domain-containing protein